MCGDNVELDRGDCDRCGWEVQFKDNLVTSGNGGRNFVCKGFRALSCERFRALSGWTGSLATYVRVTTHGVRNYIG